MAGNIVTFLVGVVCIVLGISNMRGNIATLHSYPAILPELKKLRDQVEEQQKGE